MKNYRYIIRFMNPKPFLQVEGFWSNPCSCGAEWWSGTGPNVKLTKSCLSCQGVCLRCTILPADHNHQTINYVECWWCARDLPEPHRVSP